MHNSRKKLENGNVIKEDLDNADFPESETASWKFERCEVMEV